MLLTQKPRTAVAKLVLSLSGIVVACTPVSGQSKKPNIVYIVSDDQGWKDVGYHGSDIKTPNINRLAAGGTRMEQFHA